jgi:diguanylate cyclase (GGDEF)-like protein
MKVEKPSRTQRAAGTAAYARRALPGDSATPAAAPGATASVLGIPEDEFTPRVRDAIVALMAEVDSLKRELSQTRDRLDEAEKNADLDQLLPVLNRRAFVRELSRTIAIGSRYQTPASLIYFDLNDFKTINDTHGHAAGDAVLINFGRVLSENVRKTDSVGRLGGDEFGVLLSHANQAQAHNKADQLAARLRAEPAALNGKTLTVSFAYGAFELKDGLSPDAAMALADEAMYAHKRGKK